MQIISHRMDHDPTMAALESDILQSQSTAYQDYSPERKVEVISLIEAASGNTSLVSRDTGIARQTLDYWWQNKSRFAEIQPRKRLELIQKLDYCTDLLVDSIPAKIEDATLSQVATAAGIMIDKSQLLKGLPTNITESVERQELVVILQSALAAGAEVEGEIVEETDCIIDGTV